MASGTVEMFISYARNDKGMRAELEKWLVPLRREGIIRCFHDGMIIPGQEWDTVIREHLRAANVVLLLVSIDFLASDYCEEEMQIALRRHANGEAVVIPVLLRQVDFDHSPFGHLQVLPSSAKPIVKWELQDEAWDDIIRGIRRTIAELVGARGRDKRERSQTNIEDVLRPFASISNEIRTSISNASAVWLLSRTGMGWWRDFGDQLDALIQRRAGENTRFLLLNPKSAAFGATVRYEWRPGPWHPTASFKKYKEDANSFLQFLNEQNASLKVINILVRLVVLIIYPESNTTNEPTLYVEYPTFHADYQAKPIVKITHRERDYFDTIIKAYDDLWNSPYAIGAKKV